ncbi:FecR family protein [Puteibacter caeruleilacunae]|nr:FecR family protein [Puteibacter caeruleilacunae]
MSEKRDTLKRYFHNKFNRKDYQQVNELFNDENSRPLNSLMEEHWDEFESDRKTDQSRFERILGRLHQDIQLKEYARWQTPRQKVWRLFSKIAAILILPISVALLYLLLQNNQVDSKIGWAEIRGVKGARTKFELPDGSTGTLNGESSLKYPLNFAKNRNLELEGEAFFKVVKDGPGNPFYVEVPEFTVKVLGTKFSVASYGGEDDAEVILLCGSVEVNREQDRFRKIIKPNERIAYDKVAGKFRLEEVDAMACLSWKSGTLMFRNDSINDVITKIERMYGVDVIIENESLRQVKIRGTFKNQSLEDVMQLLSESFKFKYEIETDKNEKIIRLY